MESLGAQERLVYQENPDFVRKIPEIPGEPSFL
jgi:hypothetical protein